MSSEYNGIYSFNSLKDSFEGNQPVYQMNGKCVWWHRQYRHWWVGLCENVGLNTGYAFAKEDVDCPSYEQTWRRGGSDEFLNGVHVYTKYYEAAGSSYYSPPISWSSATAGVNSVIRNGRFRKNCRPVYKNGKFKCS
jgi:hypothetical protein